MKTIRIGVDFDGVLAYNPARVARALVAWFKEKILGIKQIGFFVPKTGWQKFIWSLAHETSVFPAKGAGLLKKMAKNSTYEFHLITARYSFLDGQLNNWLARWGFKGIFKTVNLNQQDQQPHLYKQAVIRRLKLDYYIEDNWDITDYLAKNSKTKILWIYNILDKNKKYPDKFPYLEKALQKIREFK